MAGGGKYGVWGTVAVAPLWVTMAAGIAVLTVRGVHWIGYDPDQRMYNKYRTADSTDYEEALQQQGETFWNHPIRKYFQSRKSESMFPEAAFTTPTSD